MTAQNLQVRRATIEDLPKLRLLWEQEGLSWQELEKRFKEFQIVEGAGSKVIGAIGFQITGLEGRLHNESFILPEEADAAREKLWERTQVLAKNHGLVRVWTQLNSPFWHANGLKFASAEDAAKLPAAFAGSPAPWLFVQLKEEAAPAASLDKEFAMFKEAEQERTQRLFRQAKVMKMLAALIVVVVFLLALVWALFFVRYHNKGGGR